MRELLRFLRWSWQNFEGWQKAFIFAAFIQGAALPLNQPYNIWLSLISVGIIGGFIAKWCVWDGIKSNWTKYKEHRNDLLKTIKESDR